MGELANIIISNNLIVFYIPLVPYGNEIKRGLIDDRLAGGVLCPLEGAIKYRPLPSFVFLKLDHSASKLEINHSSVITSLEDCFDLFKYRFSGVEKGTRIVKGILS